VLEFRAFRPRSSDAFAFGELLFCVLQRQVTKRKEPSPIGRQANVQRAATHGKSCKPVRARRSETPPTHGQRRYGVLSMQSMRQPREQEQKALRGSAGGAAGRIADRPRTGCRGARGDHHIQRTAQYMPNSVQNDFFRPRAHSHTTASATSIGT
jgi:hypothetical protein